MARVFISFVGTGPKDGGYREIAYRLGARASRPTRFVQAAELELLGADRFDRIVLLMTNSSRDKYEAALLTELSDDDGMSQPAGLAAPEIQSLYNPSNPTFPGLP